MEENKLESENQNEMATKTTKKIVKKDEIKEETKEFKYKVESGIQMTTMRQRPKADSFPFSVMKPGDSFLIPANDPVAKNPSTLHYAAKQYARMEPGFAVTSRILLDKSRRVWRLK
jgi:dihydroxyacetone kinase-like predicted kinase